MYGGYQYGAYRYGYSLPKSNAQLQKYPEDIQCVYPSDDPDRGSIYVSNVQAAENHQTLSRLRIKAVMTCAKGYDRNIPKSKIDMFQYFPLDDKETCQILPHLEKGCDFIAKACQHTNVLVHCIAGVSRSVSMVLAYLIRDKGMSYQKAYDTVKSRRTIISPNEGFIRQLKQYAQQIKLSMGQVPRFASNQLESGPKTPQKRNISQNSTSDKYYKTTIKRTETINYKNKSDVPNQQDISIKRGFTQNFDQIKNYSEVDYCKKPSEQQTNNSSDFGKNNSAVLAKSTTFNQKSAAKIPEKKNQTSEYKNANADTNYAVRSAYFKQMNDELNQKIEAIHQKYQKQREQLLGKRLQKSPLRRDYSTSYKAANAARDRTEISTSQYIPRNYHKIDNYINNDNYQPYSYDRSGNTADRYRQMKNYMREPNKYTDLYENKYARGLRYADFSKNNSLYAPRYF